MLDIDGEIVKSRRVLTVVRIETPPANLMAALLIIVITCTLLTLNDVSASVTEIVVFNARMEKAYSEAAQARFTRRCLDVLSRDDTCLLEHVARNRGGLG